jgi:hypothetical protein
MIATSSMSKLLEYVRWNKLQGYLSDPGAGFFRKAARDRLLQKPPRAKAPVHVSLHKANT